MFKNKFYMEHCNFFWVADQPQSWTEQKDISKRRKKKWYMFWEFSWNRLWIFHALMEEHTGRVAWKRSSEFNWEFTACMLNKQKKWSYYGILLYYFLLLKRENQYNKIFCWPFTLLHFIPWAKNELGKLIAISFWDRHQLLCQSFKDRRLLVEKQPLK